MTRTSAGAGLPRSARLLRHADFERVYKLGRRHFSPSMTVFYLQRPNVPEDASSKVFAIAPGFRVGFTVGRALGSAVDRNRMKRRLREAVRLCRPPQGANADVVINPKKVLLKTDFTKIVEEVGRAFATIEIKLRAKAAEGESAEGKSNDQPAPATSGHKKQEA